MTLTQKTDHVVEALSNLLEQFKRKTTLGKILTIYVEQIQEFEDALFGTLTGRQLDYAVGAQLDGLGDIVGEERNGKTDDEYRIALKARILVNASTGTPENLIAIMNALTGSNVHVREYSPAAIIVELTTPVVTGFDAALVAVYMNEGKPAGVLAHLLYYPDNVFRFDTSGQGFDEGKYGGAI